MNVQPPHATGVGHVFSESAELCWAQTFQRAFEGDGLRLSAIVCDMEVLDLQSKVFSIPGLQNVTDGIDDGGFTRIVFTYEGSHAFVELDVQRMIAMAELAEILDLQSRKIHSAAPILVLWQGASPTSANQTGTIPP
ncbi:hypothetical protein D3C85_1138900 [compost metagenome]